MNSRDSHRLAAEKILNKSNYDRYVRRENNIISIRETYQGKFETPEDQIKNALDQFEIDSLFKRSEQIEKRKEKFNSIPEEKKKEGRSKGGKKGGKKGGETTREKMGKKVMDETGCIYDSKNQLCCLKGISKPTCNDRIKKGIYKEVEIN